MAISAPVNHNGATVFNQPTPAAKVSATWTPAGGALLYAVTYIADQNGTTRDMALTDAFSGTGGWKKRVDTTQVSTIGGTYRIRQSIWVAIAGATPGNHAITATPTGTHSTDGWCAAHFFEVASGFDPLVADASAPVGATGSGNSTSTASTATTTMSGTPDAASLVVGSGTAWDVTSSKITRPTGWTLGVDTVDATWGEELQSFYRNSGGNSASFVYALSTASAWTSVFLEIPPAPSVASVVPQSFFFAAR